MVHQDRSDEFVRRMSLYLDNELPQEAEENFLREVEQNPGYNKMFQREQQFKNIVRQSVPRRKVSPDVIEKIKDRIRIQPTSR